jgi:hypothetical protein
MSVYLFIVPFILVLNFLHGFNGQFLMLYISGTLLCFMALFKGYLPLQQKNPKVTHLFT